MSSKDHIDVAVAIADIIEYDRALADRIEGELLKTGGNTDSTTPIRIAQQTGVDRSSAGNIFRQLEEADAVTRSSHEGTMVESDYSVQTDKCRELFTVLRVAIPVIEEYIDRQPPATMVEPLVTFPDDPSFSNVSPSKFGMNQLFSALASEIKQSEDSIIIVAPFFEGEGFGRLRSVLSNAIDRGVELTIVTRYLEDEQSHNRAVIGDFLDYLIEEGIGISRVNTVDYTVWDDDVPLEEQVQNSQNPSFTLHAKVIVFDNDSAYMGSANVTDYGFDRYLELGVLLEGIVASQCRQLCEYLIDSEHANPVHFS
jgi:putative cardiolipin synthase